MITFHVPGQPVPQGSMVGRVHGGRVLLRAGNETKLRRYRKAVQLAAGDVIDAENGGRVITGPVQVDLGFYLARPVDHWRTSGELKAWAPTYHAKQNHDVDKLARAVLDGLTGSVIADDGQVVQLTAGKFYANGKDGGDERGGPRTFVKITPLEEGGAHG